MNRQNTFSNFTNDEAAEIASFLAKLIKLGYDHIYEIAHAFYKGGLHDDKIERIKEYYGVVGEAVPEWLLSPNGTFKRWRFPEGIVKTESVHPSNICREFEWKGLLNAAFKREALTPTGFDITPELERTYHHLIRISRKTGNTERYARSAKSKAVREAAPEATAIHWRLEYERLKARSASVIQRAITDTRTEKNTKYRETLRLSDRRVAAYTRKSEADAKAISDLTTEVSELRKRANNFENEKAEAVRVALKAQSALPEQLIDVNHTQAIEITNLKEENRTQADEIRDLKHKLGRATVPPMTGMGITSPKLELLRERMRG